MTEPLEQAPASLDALGEEDDYHIFVEEESVVVSSEDLFDVPTAATSLPGMDPVDSAAAMGSFTDADAEPETATQSVEGGVGSSRWRTRAALVVLGLINVVVIGAVLRKGSNPPQEIAETPPAAVVPPPTVPGDSGARPPEARKPALEPVMPAATRSGRDRLDSIESALAAGRRGFARIELGRLMLDTDGLPETEREETRAQAELLVARILQDAADEARRLPR